VAEVVFAVPVPTKVVVVEVHGLTQIAESVMAEVVLGLYGQLSIRLARSPLLEVSVVDQPPKTMFDLVGSVGFCNVPAVGKNELARAVPPFTSHETVLEFAVQVALNEEVPAGAV
jgi:hypothetical protein